MARLPRLIVAHQLHHVIQRGTDGQKIFQDTDDYVTFLAWLRIAAKQFNVAIHAYVLMPDHVHFLLSPSDQVGVARVMQWVGRYYVPYFNRKYGRVGTLWQGRYKATVIDSERYFMTCSRYIEQNPVRAGIASDPVEYNWSSYKHHVGVKPDALVTDHSKYWALGNTPFEREVAYKELIGLELKVQEIGELREATTKGWALGSEQFKLKLEKIANRRVRQAKRGRPARAEASAVATGTKTAT